MKNLLDLILDNISDVICVLKEGRIIFATASASRAGYDPSGLYGKEALSFVAEEDREKLAKLLSKLKSGDEFRTRARIRTKRGVIFADVGGKKVDDYVILFSRDNSEFFSMELVQEAMIEALKVLPFATIDEVEGILNNYFECVRIENNIVNASEGEIAIPIKHNNVTLGALVIRPPKWFVTSNRVIRALEGLADGIGKAMMFAPLVKSVYGSLDLINRASQDLAALVDGMRNPLAAIHALAEVRLDDEVGGKIREQVGRIVELIRRIEDDWTLIDKNREAIENILERLGIKR